MAGFKLLAGVGMMNGWAGVVAASVGEWDMGAGRWLALGQRVRCG